MNTYLFRTTTTMKEYNAKKWWIDSHIIREMKINAKNVKEALVKYQEEVNENTCIWISDTAIKTANPMYIDVKGEMEPKQVGYVITGRTEFDDDKNQKWSLQYVDLWVTVITVVDTEF